MNAPSRATARPEGDYPAFDDRELPRNLRYCTPTTEDETPLLVYGLLVYSSVDEIIDLAYELNLDNLWPREEVARSRKDPHFILATMRVFKAYIRSRLAREYSFRPYKAESTFTRIIGPNGEQTEAVIFSLYDNTRSRSDRACWLAPKGARAIRGLKNIFGLPDDTPLRWYFSILCLEDEDFDVFEWYKPHSDPASEPTGESLNVEVQKLTMADSGEGSSTD
ncbi:hypothetical protein FKP32DRAFT_86678 [Trametes sanguinea]|nr:hypothetical protein FKP32DRAFT_86678 [Trametes sanguinea]